MSDVDNVVKLLNLGFRSESRFTREWWYWKYKNNPAGFWGECGDAWVAEYDDEIIGHYAVIPEKFELDAKTILVAQSVDAAIHPDWRRMGVFSRLAQKVHSECKDRYCFLFGFPAETSYKGFLKLGCKNFIMTEYVRFLNYDRPIKQLIDNNLAVHLGKAFLKTWQSAKTVWSTPTRLKKHEGSQVEIQPVERFTDEIDVFWKKASSRNKGGLVRDSSFLNWRFSGKFGEYHINLSRSVQNGSIAGYSVVRKTQINRIKNVLVIVDLCALPGEDAAVVEIIKSSMEVGSNERVDMIHCRVPPWHRSATILSQLGFIEISRALRFVGIYQPRMHICDFGKKELLPKVRECFYTLADTDYV